VVELVSLAGHLLPMALYGTLSSAAIQEGISLPALQRLLGHDNLSPEEVLREFREKW
jgi:site-specific recombinase XerD